MFFSMEQKVDKLCELSRQRGILDSIVEIGKMINEFPPESHSLLLKLIHNLERQL